MLFLFFLFGKTLVTGCPAKHMLASHQVLCKKYKPSNISLYNKMLLGLICRYFVFAQRHVSIQGGLDKAVASIRFPNPTFLSNIQTRFVLVVSRREEPEMSPVWSVITTSY